ncbi:MAG: FlgD immunoglobulin-like domain containing protein [Spirochaetales bacterium]|uniref:FlgD immunoglobulin-like domain containing protein n=1 Tax=Candidatus Thalassospirochaeta sargassi TaxID=3119039 RepID=A0AAJ1MJC6_9SPIO|nr:FlgD immunoglobulin-like domain containing protein [Spirochaetales bacterium]
MSSFKKTALLAVLFLSVASISVFAFGTAEVPEIPPVTSGTQYLSPNGDGIQDEATLDFSVKIYVKSDDGYVPEYGLRISDSSGNVVAEKVEKESSDISWLVRIFRGYDEFNLEKNITWDGTDEEGNIVADGVYDVTVWVKDAANQITEIDVDDFVLDTKKPSVSVKAPDNLLFSPNNDGNGDVFIILQANGSVEHEWTAVFKDAAGKTVRTFTWENQAPGDVLWDGTDQDGGMLTDGKYSYEIQTVDLAGNKSELYTIKDIVIDGMSPLLNLEFDQAAFSPNADGIKDELVITPVYQLEEEILNWSWSLADGSGVVLQKSGEASDGLPEEVVLDGLNESGLPLFPGTYLFSMSVEYENSWRPVADEEILIDISAPRVEITPERLAFSPNGDGLGDELLISFKANEEVTWEGSIIDMKGNLVLETDYTQTSSQVKWNGTMPDGSAVPDGEYLILGVFSDLAGNITYAEPFTVMIDRRTVETVLNVPTGFSPNNDGYEDKLKIGIDADLYLDVNEWKLVVIDDSGEVLTSFRGTENLPDELVWDGMIMQEGSVAPALEGVYQAVLYVDYVKGDFVKAESDLFVLDNKAPKIDMVVRTNTFAETEEGLEGSVFISVKVEEDRDVRGWMLDVYDEHGNNIRTYAGEGNPTGDITWNTADNGINLESGGDYTVSLRVTDNAGNVATMREKVSLDVMLIKKNGKYYVMVPNIIFGAYKYKLDSAGPAREKDNYESLERIIELADRFPEYGLILDAHALNIYLGTDREDKEEDILFPLTEKRALEVKTALIDMGMDPDRIEMEAFGGQDPLVSVTDRSIRWKNRRVEFAVSGLE